MGLGHGLKFINMKIGLQLTLSSCWFDYVFYQVTHQKIVNFLLHLVLNLNIFS